MATHVHPQIRASDDLELGVPRTGPLTYHLATPDRGTPRGVVFLISGFGEDNDSGYATNLRTHIADQHGFAAVSVDYHACHSRLENGARLEFTAADGELFARYLKALKVDLATTLEETVNRMQAKLDQLPERRQLTLTADLVSPNGDHQNFGVLQALDHLAVYGDLRRTLTFDRRQVIAFGSSHGAYIAHLMMRMAPNTLTAILDNSGYAKPATTYFLGREVDTIPVRIQMTPDVSIAGFNHSLWTLKPGLPNSYGGDVHRIRDLLDSEFLAQMAKNSQRRQRIRGVHSRDDLRVAPVADKTALIRDLSTLGYDAHLTVMGPDQVDGRVVKSLEHGLGLSLKSFFAQEVEQLVPLDGDDDFARRSVITYAGDQRSYGFHFDDHGVRFSLETSAYLQAGG